MPLENTIREQIKTFLVNNKVATLATIGGESQTPQAALVYFLYDNQDCIFLATLGESRKVQNLTENISAALVIGEEGSKQTIQIEGNAEMVDDRGMRVKILSDLNKRISSGNAESSWPLLRLEPTDIVVFRLKINWLRFSSFGEDRTIVEAKGSELKEHLGL